MSSYFRFTVPGQPISWNHAYGWGNRRPRDQFGHPKLGLDGQPIVGRTKFKTDDAKRYQNDVTRIARAARPSDFSPSGLVYVGYEMLLGRDIDCDNVMKMLNDALARYVLLIDDKRFLPVTLDKQVGVAEPRVRVSVFDAAEFIITIARRGPP